MKTKTECANKFIEDFRPLIKNHIKNIRIREKVDDNINFIREGTVKEEKLFKCEIKIEELKQEVKELKHERSEYKSCLRLLNKQL